MRQNLFIFFEKNEREWNIDCKLVQLAMNRLIVDEEIQNEVIQIFNFKALSPEMIEYENSAYKNYAKERVDKDAFDKQLVSEALDLAEEHQNCHERIPQRFPPAATHFIIASYFHYMNESSFYWLRHELREIGLKPFHLTTYNGNRKYLITNSTHIYCYENDTSPIITPLNDVKGEFREDSDFFNVAID